MTEENLPPSKEPIGTRLLSGVFNLVRIFVRFVIMALLIALIVLLVFGIPFAYWRFVAPAVNEFHHLSTAQVEQQQQGQRLLNELHDIQQRADTLEIRLDSERQQAGEISQAVEGLADTQQANLELYQETQNAAAETVQEILSDIETLESRLSELASAFELSEKRVDAVEDQNRELQVRLLSEDEPINRLSRDIQLLKVLQLLTRSRLFIYQNNYGLAQDDLDAARISLMKINVPENQAANVADVIDRIDQALDNLPASPDLAAGEIEIAWQLLNSRLFSDSEGSDLPARTISDVTDTPPVPGTITNTPTP